MSLISTSIFEGMRVISINTVATDKKGELHFFESQRDIPFNIKRIYYISDVPAEVRRGGHAHKHLQQLLFCPYGSIQIELSNGKERFTIQLDRPDKGVLIEKPIWRDILWIKKNSVLCVAASEYYNEEDYIRSYQEFIKYIEV